MTSPPIRVSSPASGTTLAAGTSAKGGTSSFRLDVIDGYRAIAAIAVVIYHVARGGPLAEQEGDSASFVRPEQLGAHLIDNFGNYGVAVFFLLSGFVIFRPFAQASIEGEQRPAIASYLIRRALRIFPAYWIALVGWSLISDADQRVGGSNVGKLLLVDTYDPNVVFLVGLAVSWTLTIEIAFYLFVPLYAIVVARIATLGRESDRSHRLKVHLVGLTLLYTSAYAYRITLDHWSGASRNMTLWLPNFLDWFALGMLLAVLSVWVKGGGSLPTAVADFARRTSACLACAALCFAMVVVLKGDQLGFRRSETFGQMSWRTLFQGFSAFFLILPAILGNPDQTMMHTLRRPTMVFLGSISYGIYLWHTLVLQWYEQLIDNDPAWLKLVVVGAAVLCVTIPIATVSYYLVERPILGLYRPQGNVQRQRSGSRTGKRRRGSSIG